MIKFSPCNIKLFYVKWWRLNVIFLVILIHAGKISLRINSHWRHGKEIIRAWPRPIVKQQAWRIPGITSSVGGASSPHQLSNSEKMMLGFVLHCNSALWFFSSCRSLSSWAVWRVTKKTISFHFLVKWLRGNWRMSSLSLLAHSSYFSPPFMFILQNTNCNCNWLLPSLVHMVAPWPKEFRIHHCPVPTGPGRIKITNDQFSKRKKHYEWTWSFY